MPNLAYVGPAAVNPNDLVNRLTANSIFNSATVNRTDVSSQIHTTATTTYADKVYIDNQDALYQLPSYYIARDALNIPTSSIGQPNGVANLDSSGKVPLAQIPVLGAGYLLGPFGWTSTPARAVAGQSPIKIVDFAIGPKSITFQPVFLATVMATQASGGRCVIEARMSDGPSSVYSSQTLIARGFGRTLYNDLQPVVVIPVPATNGATPTSYPSDYDTFISLWVFDNNQSSTVENDGGIVSAGAWLLRTAE